MKKISKDRKVIKKLLRLTKFLTKEYFTGKEDSSEVFKMMLLGTCKKNYYFLHSIDFLGISYKNGDAIIDLSRSMFENLICIAFVQEFKPLKKALQFFKYTPVELWDDTEYAQKIGIEIPTDILDKRKGEYESVKDEFARTDPKEVAVKTVNRVLKVVGELGILIRPETKQSVTDKYLQEKFGDKVIEPDINRSWAGVSLEEMMLELEKKGTFPKNLKITFEKAYSIGNRKNHLSPVDVETMLDNPKRHAFRQRENRKIGIFIAALSHLKLVMELAKEKGDDKLKLELEKLEKEFLSVR